MNTLKIRGMTRERIPFKKRIYFNNHFHSKINRGIYFFLFLIFHLFQTNCFSQNKSVEQNDWSIQTFHPNGNTAINLSGSLPSGSLRYSKNLSGRAIDLNYSQYQVRMFDQFQSQRVNMYSNQSIPSDFRKQGIITLFGDENGAEMPYLSMYNTALNDTNVDGDRWDIGTIDFLGATFLTFFFNGNISSYILYDGSYVMVSDENLKKDFEEINNGLHILNKLSPKSYTLINNEKGQFGFLAQELAEVIPEIVQRTENEEMDRYHVNYRGIIPILSSSMTELRTENKNIRKSLDEQTDRANALNDFLNKLK